MANLGEAVQAERAPVVAGQIASDEVPAPTERDQAVRFDVSGATPAVLGRIGELEPLIVPAGLGDAGEHRGVHRLGIARGAAPQCGNGHRAERTRLIGAAIGSDITFGQLTKDEEQGRLRSCGYPEEYVESGIELDTGAPEQAAVVHPTVEQVTGRLARTFVQWVRENAAAFRG